MSATQTGAENISTTSSRLRNFALDLSNSCSKLVMSSRYSK